MTSPDWTFTFLRVASGLAMLPYGWSKIENYAGTMQFMTGMGIPSFVAMLVVAAETVGAVSLVLGFATRFCAASLAVVMVGAVIAVHGMGYMQGFATPLLFLLMFLPLVVKGAGAWSIDRKIAALMK